MLFQNMHQSNRYRIQQQLKKNNIPYEIDYSSRRAIITVKHIDKLIKKIEARDIIVKNSRNDNTHTRYYTKISMLKRLKEVKEMLDD